MQFIRFVFTLIVGCLSASAVHALTADDVRAMAIGENDDRAAAIARVAAAGDPKAPAFFHCPLVVDSSGNRLAKRHDALSLRTLRSQGVTAEELRARFSVPELPQLQVSPRVV